MNRFERFAKNGLMVFVLAMATIGLPGCGGDDGDVPPVVPENPIALSGHVLKGAVAGATVNVRAITATGVVGAVVGGPFTTDANGRWSGEVPGGTSGAHAVTANGGSYTDESTGSTVDLVSEMRGIVMVGQSNVGNVTPITHAVFVNGVYRIQLGASRDAAFSAAIGDMTTALGFDPTTITPVADTSLSPAGGAADMDIYTAILAGFSEIIATSPELGAAFDNAETWAIVEAVATDLSDGKLDGIDILGNGIFVDDGNGQGNLLPFPALDADDISNLVDAANAWAAINLPGVTVPPLDLSFFGNPGVLPPSDYTVTGSLEVTGSDRFLLGEGDPPSEEPAIFTPTDVHVELDSSHLSGIASFTFYVNNQFHSVSVLTDPNGVREITLVSAMVPGHNWL
jgi:hypothetical protein